MPANGDGDGAAGGARSIWLVAAIALLGGSGGAAVLPALAPAIYRPEPWTRIDAQAQEERIIRRVAEDTRLAKREAALAAREVESRIRADMPPAQTKARIIYLELMCRRMGARLDMECAPPSLEFASNNSLDPDYWQER